MEKKEITLEIARKYFKKLAKTGNYNYLVSTLAMLSAAAEEGARLKHAVEDVNNENLNEKLMELTDVVARGMGKMAIGEPAPELVRALLLTQKLLEAMQ